MGVSGNGGSQKPLVSILRWSNFGWFGVSTILGKLHMKTLKRPSIHLNVLLCCFSLLVQSVRLTPQGASRLEDDLPKPTLRMMCVGFKRRFASAFGIRARPNLQWLILIFLEANSFFLFERTQDRKQRAEPLLAHPILWTWAARRRNESRKRLTTGPWTLPACSLVQWMSQQVANMDFSDGLLDVWAGLG